MREVWTLGLLSFNYFQKVMVPSSFPLGIALKMTLQNKFLNLLHNLVSLVAPNTRRANAP